MGIGYSDHYDIFRRGKRYDAAAADSSAMEANVY